MEKSSFRKKAIEKKSRGDERGFFFSQEHHFFEGDFWENQFSNAKNTRRR